MKNLTLLLVFSFLSLPFWGQNYIKNGSFEYGLNTGWTHEVTGDASATFSLIKNPYVMDGNVGMLVDITKPPKTNPYRDIKSTTYMTASEDSIYLLRFWARGEERSTIYVEIEGETKQGVLFEMHPGRHFFNYPFKYKSTQKDIKINFYFMSVTAKGKDSYTTSTKGKKYQLDGVEVLDQNNNEGMDVLNTYTWNWMRPANKKGWVAGDNDISLALPDGRTIWFFNDSNYGTNNPNYNPLYDTGTFIRNAVLVQEKDGTLNTFPFVNQGGQNTTIKAPEPIYTSGNNISNLVWVRNAFLYEDTVRVYLIEVNGNAGTNRSYVGKYSYPDLVYRGAEKQASYCTTYESFFVDDNDTIYAYKKNNGSHVARAHISNFSGNREEWEFWTGKGWEKGTAGRNKSVRVSEVPAESFIKLGEKNYAQVAQYGVYGPIQVAFAQAPQGPWTKGQVVYNIPKDSAYNWYMPNIHAQLANGKYSVSYSTNSYYKAFLEGWEAYVDKYWYRQRYIQIDLLGLSPYTTDMKDCAGVVNGTAYKDECNECVGGTTGKKPCFKFPVAKLYAGDNLTGNSIGLKVGDYLLKDLTAMGFSDNSLASLKLKDGYVAELFDMDNFSGDSKIINSTSANLDSESFKNKTTSLIIRREGACNLSGIYKIQNKQSELYLDMENESTEENAILVQSNGTESNSQTFELKYVGNGYYEIINRGSNLKLSIPGFSTEDGVSIEQSDIKMLNITNFGGKITAQYKDSEMTERVENLIDNSGATKFLTPHNKAWVQFQSNIPWVIKHYSIIPSANGNTNSDPRNWTLQGSNNGIDWTTLDTRSGNSFSRPKEKFFDIPNNETAYSYYRLEMSCLIGTTLQLAEWRLFAVSDSENEYDNQKFIVQDAGGGYVRIINKFSDKVLDTYNGLNNGDMRTFQMSDLNQASALWKLISTSMGIKSTHKNSKINLYPNPTEQELNLDLTEEWTGSNFHIYNVSGIPVLSGVITNETPIDVSLLYSGYYLLKINKDNDTFVGNFIKK